MWRYQTAFIYLRHPKNGAERLLYGGCMHTGLIMDLCNDVGFEMGEKILETWQILPGHIGSWKTMSSTDPGYDPNPGHIAESTNVLVFFSHGLTDTGRWDNESDLPWDMLKSKAAAKIGLDTHYHAPREATPEEHFQNINSTDPYINSHRWYTNVENVEDYSITSAVNYNLEQARRFLDRMYPDEVHSAGGDCANPKCNYEFTEGDKAEMINMSGWFTCPQCGYVANYLDPMYADSGYSKIAAFTAQQMGDLGEAILSKLGEVPGVGKVITYFDEANNPIDFIIGKYGVELKTNHSESNPRFTLTGKGMRERKIEYCQQHNLTPAIMGCRLNFYTDKADIFFREGMSTTYIGNPKLLHVATVDFSDLNPFRRPEDVPPPSDLPEEDDIPF